MHQGPWQVAAVRGEGAQSDIEELAEAGRSRDMTIDAHCFNSVPPARSDQ